jgi:hypothetical protein
VRPIRLYDLRHTFGSMALWRGADLKTVASIMGHDPVMLQRVYAHIQEGARRKTMESVAAALGGDEEAPEAHDAAGEASIEGISWRLAAVPSNFLVIAHEKGPT